MTLPVSVPSDGTLRLDFVPTIANPAAPTVAELTAVAAQQIDGYVTGEGWQPSGEQATVTDTRVASTQDFEQPGRKTKSLTLVYVHNPTSPTDNEAYTTLAEGTTGFIVARYGKPRTTAYAASDKVDVWPVTCGEPMKNFNGANSVHTVTQRLFVTGEVQIDATVAA